jgi:hypothetical protein
VDPERIEEEEEMDGEYEAVFFVPFLFTLIHP